MRGDFLAPVAALIAVIPLKWPKLKNVIRACVTAWGLGRAKVGQAGSKQNSWLVISVKQGPFKKYFCGVRDLLWSAHLIFHPICCMVDNIITVFFPSQVIAEHSHGDNRQTLQELQQENLLQTLPSGPSYPRSRQRWSQHRHQGVLPPPEPEEDPGPFILDLRNFPELANSDMGSQNPNIQVGNMHVGRLVVSLELGLSHSSHSMKGSSHHWSAGVQDYTSDHRRWGCDTVPLHHSLRFCPVYHVSLSCSIHPISLYSWFESGQGLKLPYAGPLTVGHSNMKHRHLHWAWRNKRKKGEKVKI